MEQPLTDVARGRRGEAVDDLMCPRIGEGTAEYECMTWREIAEEARHWAISQALLRLAAAEQHFGGSAAPAGLPLPSRQRWGWRWLHAHRRQRGLLAERIAKHILDIVEAEFPA
ncbi:MAG: hypothetical protein QOF15_3977 [Mycobacterium sp.]|nr:hypothetical protein [Mycobacterium sp.]